MPSTGSIFGQTTVAGADVMRQWVAFFQPTLAIDRQRLSQVLVRSGSRRFVPALFGDGIGGSGPSAYFDGNSPTTPAFPPGGGGGSGPGGGGGGPGPPVIIVVPSPDPGTSGTGVGGPGSPGTSGPGAPGSPGAPGAPGEGGGGAYPPRTGSSSSSSSSSSASSSSSSTHPWPSCMNVLMASLAAAGPGSIVKHYCDYTIADCNNTTDDFTLWDDGLRSCSPHPCDVCADPPTCIGVDCCGLIYSVNSCTANAIYCVCSDGTWIQI